MFPKVRQADAGFSGFVAAVGRTLTFQAFGVSGAAISVRVRAPRVRGLMVEEACPSISSAERNRDALTGEIMPTSHDGREVWVSESVASAEAL